MYDDQMQYIAKLYRTFILSYYPLVGFSVMSQGADPIQLIHKAPLSLCAKSLRIGVLTVRVYSRGR